MATTFETTCPSGMRGMFRRFKVADEAVLTDARLSAEGRLFTELARLLWQETLDPGPYVLAGGKVDWRQAVQADVFHVVLQARIETLGKDIAFQAQCPDTTCRRKFEHTVDLSALPYTKMNPELIPAIQDQNGVLVTLSDGLSLRVRPLCAQDMQTLAQVERKTPSRLSIQELCIRVVEIDGVEKHTAKIVAAIEDLDRTAADELRDVIDRMEGGYDTEIGIECPNCRNLWETRLPFTSSFFTNRKGSSRTPTAATG